MSRVPDPKSRKETDMSALVDLLRSDAECREFILESSRKEKFDFCLVSQALKEHLRALDRSVPFELTDVSPDDCRIVYAQEFFSGDQAEDHTEAEVTDQPESLKSYDDYLKIAEQIEAENFKRKEKVFSKVLSILKGEDSTSDTQSNGNKHGVNRVIASVKDPVQIEFEKSRQLSERARLSKEALLRGDPLLGPLPRPNREILNGSSTTSLEVSASRSQWHFLDESDQYNAATDADADADGGADGEEADEDNEGSGDDFPSDIDVQSIFDHQGLHEILSGLEKELSLDEELNENDIAFNSSEIEEVYRILYCNQPDPSMDNNDALPDDFLSEMDKLHQLFQAADKHQADKSADSAIRIESDSYQQAADFEVLAEFEDDESVEDENDGIEKDIEEGKDDEEEEVKGEMPEDDLDSKLGPGSLNGNDRALSADFDAESKDEPLRSQSPITNPPESEVEVWSPMVPDVIVAPTLSGSLFSGGSLERSSSGLDPDRVASNNRGKTKAFNVIQRKK